MTLEQVIEEVSALSAEDQLALLEFLTRHIRETRKGIPAENLRGILASLKNVSDEELHEDYVHYLEEKYR